MFERLREFAAKHCSSFPTIARGRVGSGEQRLTSEVKPEEWPHPYKEYPSAARLGLNATPADYALSGTRVWFVAPEIFYPDACFKAFGNRLRIPCPYCKSAEHVGASGWTDVPRRVNELGRCDWALARRYK